MTGAALAASHPTLRDIQAVVKDDLAEFRRSFRGVVQEESDLLTTILRYILRRKGKRVRPTLVLLSARVCGGVTDASFRAATLVELLHTATLVHDDVVDESETRRGAFSINALWGNKVAVLVGDYFLSRGLQLALAHDDTEMLHILSNAVRRMAQGELMQVKKARNLDLDESAYFRIIADKTASLIAACTVCGAVSASAGSKAKAQMNAVGEHLGLAFQIRDDLFDYESHRVGKPVGSDLQKKLVTLPLIHALDQCEPMRRRAMLRILRRGGRRANDRQAVLAFASEYGGLDYARAKMAEHVHAAQSLLGTFEESPARTAMISLAQYIITRRH